MNDNGLLENSSAVRGEIEWLRNVLEQRLKLHTSGEHPENLLTRVAPPGLPQGGSPYVDVIRELALRAEERLVLALSLTPHIHPSVLDPLLIRNQALERRFTEFGGVLGGSHSGLLPTCETAMFLLAGENVAARMQFVHLFCDQHQLFAKQVLRLNQQHPHEPILSSVLELSPEYRERLLTGRNFEPPFSPEFPAQRISTKYEWNDLVLAAETRRDIDDIVTWTLHQQALMDDWGLRKRIKAGYRSLFYGPPGTGKTLTACLLGKESGMPVFRIDLSKVVSKYIGETEKNLASLFDHAQHRQWILFFDEADSLFGKRTDSRNASDRAANQQISYLLQRIEDFPGTCILATNQRAHLDEAFSRRFQSMVQFRMPDFEQRLKLWQDCFADTHNLMSPDIDLHQIAREHTIAGGSIINVLRYACLKAIARTPPEIHSHDISYGIRLEMEKVGRNLNVATLDS